MHRTLRQLVDELERVRSEIADAESLDDLASCSSQIEQLVAQGHDSVNDWEKALYLVLHDRDQALRRVA